ncbi:MAG: helix-turn-helix domain-containing protein, partial [Proteobacteria bacterium]|nr:helix-turn-helix domain-containing protein [Pseudomonadota bacterium]
MNQRQSALISVDQRINIWVSKRFSLYFDKTGFLERLEVLRSASGLSKGDFSARVGVAQIFSRYAPDKPGQKERKIKAPSVETLLRISQEFNA